MGTWSYKILGNDTSCEIREIFIERYNSNLDTEGIKKIILEERAGLFNCNPYDAWLGFAMICWECKCLDKKTLKKIKNIVESGIDLQYNRELDATDEFLDKREKELYSFLHKISIPKTKAKRRVKPPKLYDFRLRQGDFCKIKISQKLEIIILITESKHYKNKGEIRYINLMGDSSTAIENLVIPTKYYWPEDRQWSQNIGGGSAYSLTYEKEDKEDFLKIISNFKKIESSLILDFSRLTYSIIWTLINYKNVKEFIKLLKSRWIEDTSIDYRATTIGELIEHLKIKEPANIE